MSAERETVRFKGGMKAGLFTAQLGVELVVSERSATLTAFNRSYQIDRENCQGLEDTSILGVFKRGVRFVHQQPGVPETLVFYPSGGRDELRRRLGELGWG